MISLKQKISKKTCSKSTKTQLIKDLQRETTCSQSKLTTLVLVNLLRRNLIIDFEQELYALF